MLQNLWKHSRQYLGFICWSLAIFVTGLSLGLLIERYHVAAETPSLTATTINTPEIPLLFFEKIENGILYGRNDGLEARFVVGKDQEIFPVQKGPFSFSVSGILPNLLKIPAPMGMSFVASARGKKFWALDAPEAALIPVKNRVFFPDAQTAQAKGFVSGK